MKNQKTKTWTRSQSQAEGSLWEICLFVVFFVLIFSAVARAEAKTPPPNVSVNEYGNAGKTVPSMSSDAALRLRQLRKQGYGDVWKPSAKAVISTSRTLQEEEEPSYGGAYELTLGASNKYLGLSGSARVGYSREYSFQRDDGTDGSMDNPSAVISKKFVKDEWDANPSAIWKYVDGISWSVSGALPGNAESERRTFQGSLGTSVGFAKSIRRLDLSQGFGYTRGFYEYDIRDDGTVNAPDSFKSTTSLGYNVTDKLALSLSVALSHAINYQGTGKTAEMSSLSLDYAFNKHVQTSLGVATERGTMLPDGETNRVRVFDPEVASAFFDLVIGL